jgi:hypothetical protein
MRKPSLVHMDRKLNRSRGRPSEASSSGPRLM